MTKVATGNGLKPFRTTSNTRHYLIHFKGERHFERSLALWWINAMELNLAQVEMDAAIRAIIYWSERHRCTMYCLKLNKYFVDR